MDHIKYLHASIHEAAHKRFKEIHGLTFKRQGSGVRKVFKKHDFQTNNGIPQSNVNNKKVKQRNKASKNNGIKRNQTFSVRNGPYV